MPFTLNKTTFFIFFFCASFLLQAQKPVSVPLLERDGLPDKEFYSIIEDNKGFIWLAADKGLFKYDGKEYKNYKNNLQRGLSVFGLQKDTQNRIWCNNISGQFFYVEDNKLKLFTDLSKQLKGELADFIVAKDFIWVFTIKNIYKIDIKTKQTTTFFSFKKRIGAPFTFNNTIYFENRDTIFYITPKNKLHKKLHLKSFKINKKGVSFGKSKIFKTKLSLFVMQKKFGENIFFQYNLKSKKNNRINDFSLLAKERIYNEFANGNQLWFATNSGVWVYEFKNNHFILKRRFLEHLNVTKIIKDKDENYWFTTLNNGVFIIPNIFIEQENVSEENKNITCLDKINDSTLVFGTANGKVSIYNTANHTEKTIKLPTNYRVSTLKYHPYKNSVFISTDKGGYKLNVKTLQLQYVNKFSTIKSIAILNNNDIFYTDYKEAKLLKKGNSHNKPTVLVKDRRSYASCYLKNKQNIFVAFVDNLVVYDSLFNAKIIKYNTKSIFGKSITKTNDNMVWVATFKDGIYGIKNNAVLKHYTVKNGLSSNNILKIKADKNDLWIATNNSVQVLNTTTKKIKTLTKYEGILSYDISGIEIIQNNVYLSSNLGLSVLNKNNSFKTQHPEVYFNTFKINEKDAVITNNYELNYRQNAIKIGFNVNGFLFNRKEKYQYRLKGFNNNWLTTEIGENSVKYNSLPSGDYTFEVQPFTKETSRKDKIKSINFTIAKPFWKTWWFITLIIATILGGVIIYFNKKIKEKEKERIAELEKISLEKELISQNLTALRSQMNPHFIFNALNSIQDLVLKQDTDASYDYIVLFAKLIRNTLSYSNQDFISIEKELAFLNVYLQLEKLRFGDDFNYNISFNSTKELEIPSLLIQPFIENALLHGLLHKAGKKELTILFSFTNNTLQCVIIDNGIGRKKAQEINQRRGNNHESFALKAIKQRLKILQKQHQKNIGYIIEDLYEKNEPKGTRVTITMPFKRLF